MTPEEFQGKIVAASTQLDHENDEHWTKDGKPDMATMIRLAGVDSLKRADVEKALPDFVRRERPVAVKNEKKIEIEHEEVPVRATEVRPKSKIAKGATVMLAKKVDNVLMRAKERGYYGGEVKEEGDVFRFTGRPGSWMEPC